jgi:DUF4097 and DUF4098 domain-containing protein YvlB
VKKSYCIVGVFNFLILLLVSAVGCNIQIGDWARAKYEKTVHQQRILESGTTIKVGTSSGSININGAEVTDCEVVAKISVRAPTEQEAYEIAEDVEIILEQVGNVLTVKADKPHLSNNRSISISYDITVPKQTNVQCNSSYGALKLKSIDGDIIGKTSSGSINAENIEGSIDLHTSYGSVTCLDISGGDIKLKTSSGGIKLSMASFGECNLHTSYGSVTVDESDGDSINIHSSSGSINVTDADVKVTDVSTSYGHITCRQITTSNLTAKSGSGGIDIICSDSTPSDMTANVVTSYGSIDFVAPPDFSGEVELGTSYGSVRTDLPVTISGKVSKKNIAGMIGQGSGKLYLKTSSGSIKLK